MRRITNFEKSRRLQARAHELIPAGCHTYSKGDDQFPALAPGFLARARGCRVWDADGNEFLDWGMGLRSVVLGHGHPRVLEAVREQLELGTNFTRPSPIEVELAELLAATIPCAEMVKFAKNGSDVTSAAVRLARAFTGREMVALCRQHPFFSFYDWFIGTTPCNAGVPGPVRDLSLTFDYNDLGSVERLFREHPGRIACVILEPAATEEPRDGFLEGLQALARKEGALLVFDEMITGFRWHLRGAQHHYGVTPDVATFGKAIGNGFAVSVLAGRRDVMELGGIRHDRPRVFLLSATHGAENHSLAAAIATIREFRDREAHEHLRRTGRALKEGFNALSAGLGLGAHVRMLGFDASPYVVCRGLDGEVSLPLRTLFLQETIARGLLMPWISVSLAHGEREVAETLEACDGALRLCRAALEEGIERHLVGPAVKPVFRRFN